jgi:hypothetical protein
MPEQRKQPAMTKEQLASIVQPGGPLAHNVTSKDVHLLGAISRVRFPEFPWSHQTQES